MSTTRVTPAGRVVDEQILWREARRGIIALALRARISFAIVGPNMNVSIDCRDH